MSEAGDGVAARGTDQVEAGTSMAGAGGESGAGETLCEECRACAFKYKCPGCGAKTCSLACVRAHKARTSCTGLRDKTKYLPMDKMGDRELFSDIAFLDDAKRVRDVARRCRPIPPRKENNLPHFMKTLRFQARKRGTRLLFLQPGMERRTQNTTYYHRGKDQLYWRVEWRFKGVEGVFASGRVEDTQVLSEALLSHFAMTKDNALSCHKLRDYARAGLDGIVACLPLHRQRPGQGEAFELDLHKSLADNLLGKTVVEFPVVHVGLKGQDPGFALVRGDARGGEGQPKGPEST